jgi:hypothetical protein
MNSVQPTHPPWHLTLIIISLLNSHAIGPTILTRAIFDVHTINNKMWIYRGWAKGFYSVCLTYDILNTYTKIHKNHIYVNKTNNEKKLNELETKMKLQSWLIKEMKTNREHKIKLNMHKGYLYTQYMKINIWTRLGIKPYL